MKYAFIEEQRSDYPISALCSALDASRSGFYRWLKNPLSERKRKDGKLKPMIIRAHADSRKTYGSPRIHASLQNQGERVGRKRVARLMDELSIRSIIRKRKKNTTDSKHHKPVAGNIPDRNFNPPFPNDVWASDITCIRTGEGWLYLAIVIDLRSRKAVGWSMSDGMKTKLPKDALEMAVQRNRPRPGLLLHSDRGSQYASKEFQEFLADNEIVCSMSRKGNCYDNAVAESFFHSLKTEWANHREYRTREEARKSVFEYIEVFYNRQRLHSSLGYKTPEEFESEF